jgi:CheY-like chemotaxis protein
MSKRRILIVEDEAIIAADLQKQLQWLGYRIDGCARSGEEAVRLARQMSPHLVLMDIRLAGLMNGLEAARQIYEELAIPIVYTTAFANLLMQNPYEMQPPHLCVAKPFLIQDLRTVINIALAG